MLKIVFKISMDISNFTLIKISINCMKIQISYCKLIEPSVQSCVSSTQYTNCDMHKLL